MVKISSDSLPHYQPGQYFFINIPCISLNEWHPFTASAVLDDGILLYIKSMGKPQGAPKSWTSKLADLARRGLAHEVPMLRLSGPFGHINLDGYETILLFAGGIGITPMIAIFAELRRRLVAEDLADQLAEHKGQPVPPRARLKRVRLMWMSRKVDEFRLFEKIFSYVRGDVARTHKSTRESRGWLCCLVCETMICSA
jgi:hypothetical protein